MILTYFRLKSFKPFFWSIKLSAPSFLPSECLNFLSVGESEKREPPSKSELECLAVHSRQTEVALFFLRFLRATFFLLPLRDIIWCLANESYFKVRSTWQLWLNAFDSLETNSSSPTLCCNSYPAPLDLQPVAHSLLFEQHLPFFKLFIFSFRQTMFPS